MKKVILIFISILLVISLAVGISYASWYVTSVDNDNTVVGTECFDFTFTEDSNSDISLLNTFPITDEAGMELTPYTFSIANTCDMDMKYYINLEVSNTSTLSEELLKVVIDDNTPDVLSNKDMGSAINDNYTSYSLELDYLASGEVNNHEFRMWLDHSATLENSQNKDISAKIVISGSPVDKIPLPPYVDPVLFGSDPVLDSKMIPVLIDDVSGVVTIADISDVWYNYNESKWANVVIVDPTFTTLDSGTTIPMEFIEQMYVWIPRYKYNKSSIVNAQESIEVSFVSLSETSTTDQVNNDDVIVHPAFCWGNFCQTNREHSDNVELPGIWVAKFELGWVNGFIDISSDSSNDWVGNSDTETTYVIKPNVISAHDTNLSRIYYNIHNTNDTYSLDTSTDSHMIKNTEWGAVAYLSQSQYGICEDDVTCSTKIMSNSFYNNSSYDMVTGCGGEDAVKSVSTTGINICPASNRWETTNGTKASTTHNVTGIYDMAGGKSEFVMGNMQYFGIDFYASQVDFVSIPESRYYDSYLYGSSSSDYSRGLPGDATIELYPLDGTSVNWNGTGASFTRSSSTFFIRGGRGDSTSAGVWSFGNSSGVSSNVYSSRSVLIIEP